MGLRAQQRCHRVLPTKCHLSPTLLRVPSNNSPMAPWGQGKWSSWEGSPGGDTSWESHTPPSPFSSLSPKGHYFCQKKKKFCTAVQQQLVRKVAAGGSGGMRSHQTAPGTSAPSCLQPGPPSPGPPRPPFAPSQPSQRFGIVSPPNTHRCRNLESFHTTQALFPERGCEFLLSLGRGRCSAWLHVPPHPSPASTKPEGKGWEKTGKKLGKSWEKSSEIRASLERVWRQSSH